MADGPTATLMCDEALLGRSLAGRAYVVTGGTKGIGLETCLQLSKMGATVLAGCRRPEELTSHARFAEGPGRIAALPLDLADLGSVRAFAAACRGELGGGGAKLAALVNNAGVAACPYGRSKDGFELQLATNHLGHFLLTELLLEDLRAAAPSRIVCLSSSYHDTAMGVRAHLDVDDPNFEKGRAYDKWASYGQSKLCNVLHAMALARRLEGTGVTAVSAHPGWVPHASLTCPPRLPDVPPTPPSGG